MKVWWPCLLALCFSSGAFGAGDNNLLKNSGFEEEGFWLAHEAASVREHWRSHDGGRCNAAILGRWAGLGEHGMIEQRGIPVEAGRRYELEGWLWGDPGWRPQRQYARITFYDAEGFVVGEETHGLSPAVSIWTLFQCVALAPAGASTASVALAAHFTTGYGSLTIDDLYFGAE